MSEMTAKPDSPDQVMYEFRVRAHLGESLLQAFPQLEAQTEGSDTLLVGMLPDQAAVHGVLAMIEALGIELVEMRRRAESLDAGDAPSPFDGRR